jgi:uncharacterized 2Fe-2S/4Fe-4S cluster protein (DUF4445 family)
MTTRQPSLGDTVIYRETEYVNGRDGVETHDRAYPATVTREIPGSSGVYVDTEDAAMHGIVPRWMPAPRVVGNGSYGWCWPDELNIPAVTS